nr:hypothetical protein [Tanacetum cinerariifolium]
LDHEVHLVYRVELYGDHPQSEGQSLHASRPNRLCAQAQSVDDMPFRKQVCTEYTRCVYYKLCGRPSERHLACMTRRHGSRPLSFLIFFLNHGLILPPPTCLRMIRDSKTVSDTVLKHDLCKLVIAEVRTAITNDGTGGSKSSKERF